VQASTGWKALRDLVFVTEEYPYPATSGGKVAAATLLESLCQVYAVHLFGLIPVGQTIADPTTVKMRSVNVWPSRLDTHRNPALTALRVLNSWRMGLPFTIHKAWHTELKRTLDETIARLGNPLILAERLQTVPYVYEYPYYLVEHNVEYALAQGRATVSTSVIDRALWHKESRLLRIYERIAVTHANGILALSPDDRRHLIGEFNLDPQRIWQTYLPVTQPWGYKTDEGCYVAIVGSAVWHENATGLQWFMRSVLPKMPLDIPLLVAGRSVRKIIGNAVNERKIKVLEEFNGMNELLNDIRILVVPVQNASGIRMKILQALDAGVPVVSTTAGVKGLPLAPGIGVRVASSADHMVEMIVSVYHNEGLRADMVRKGREFIATVSMPAFSNQLHGWLE
jgi:glycosyltransferase involved in cell wall biosynthesis